MKGCSKRHLVLLVATLTLTGCSVLRMLATTGEQFTERIQPSDTRGCRIDDVVYESDGISIRGWIVRPEKDGTYPLLMLNHGYTYGILEQRYFDRDTSPFIYRGCMLARRGYVVFVSHYRGFGASEGKQTFGPGEVKDVIAAIELMKREPYVEPTHIGLAGESEGGMISLFVASMRTDITCVVVVSAPVELTILFESLPPWMRKVAAVPGLYSAIGGTPDEAPHEYRKRSALYSAHRIGCPVLIIHGMEDPIVPVEQAYLLREELARAGIAHETLIIPGATHGIFTGRNGEKANRDQSEPNRNRSEPNRDRSEPRRDEASGLVWRRANEFLDRHLQGEWR